MSNVAPLRRTVTELHHSAPEVAAQLRSAEKAIDQAIEQIAALTAKMVQVRFDSNISATLTQDAFSPVGEAMDALIKGRGKVVDVHNALAVTGDKMRIDPKSYAGYDYKG